MTLLCRVSSHSGPQLAEDGAAGVALEAASDLAVRAALSASAGNVVASGWVVAHAGSNDDVEGAVELPIA
jgi:hypothetical protein